MTKEPWVRALYGDCLDKMDKIKDRTVNLILCDLPYGTTDCAWDSLINLSELWAHYKRVLSPTGCVVLTASQPFTSVLVSSNLNWFKVEWVWQKNAGSNFGTVKWQPMKEHESVLVFAPKKASYNPIMQERAESGKARVKTVINYASKAEVYQKGNLGNEVTSKRPDLRYPSSIQKFNRERGLHPTQKPVALIEYFIRTYSNAGDVVMDNCMGSGTTGVACMNSGRNFVGIEKDRKYFDISVGRIKQAKIDKYIGLVK